MDLGRELLLRKKLTLLGERLHHAELHFTFLGNHFLVPSRFPDYFDFGFADVVEGHDARLSIGRDDGAHATTGGGEGHLDVNFDFLGVGFVDGAIVDKAKINDVDGNLGVVDLLHLVPDLLFEGGVGHCFVDGFFFLFSFEVDAEGVGVFAGDSDETRGGGHGVGAAKGLSDHDGSAGWEGDGISRRNLDGCDFAGKSNFFVHVERLERVGAEGNFLGNRFYEVCVLGEKEKTPPERWG